MELQTAWGGFLPAYLFLGGLGGSMLLVAAVLDAVGLGRHRRTVRPTGWLALAALAVGALILVADLGVPLRGLLLWQSFSNLGSWLSIGAWVLLLCLAASAGFVLVCRRRGKGRCVLRRLYDAVCAIIGLCVCAYTGVLLMSSTAIVTWSSWLLPALFVASSLNAGVAASGAVYRMREKKKRARRMGAWNIAELLCAAIEAVFLGLYVDWLAGNVMTAPASEMLLVGQWAVPFWLLVVAVGILAPIVLAGFGLWRDKDPKLSVLVSALCVLVGNVTLRFLVLAIGMRIPFALL